MRKTVCKCKHCKREFHITEKDAKQKTVNGYVSYSCECPFCKGKNELGNNEIMSLSLKNFFSK